MAEIVNMNQFRNGMHIEVDGTKWRIVEFQHVKPGKGGAFVRTKLKALDSGAVVDKTFRAGEKFARVHTEVKSVQYLYDDGSEAHFMDQETYEQFAAARVGRGGARLPAAVQPGADADPSTMCACGAVAGLGRAGGHRHRAGRGEGRHGLERRSRQRLKPARSCRCRLS